MPFWVVIFLIRLSCPFRVTDGRFGTCGRSSGGAQLADGTRDGCRAAIKLKCPRVQLYALVELSADAIP